MLTGDLTLCTLVSVYYASAYRVTSFFSKSILFVQVNKVNSGIDFPNFLNQPVFDHTLHFISEEIVLPLLTVGFET